MKYKGTMFFILLCFIYIILYFCRNIAKKFLQNDRKYSKKFTEFMSYTYILFYSIIGGILIYFGLENFKCSISGYIKDVSLCGLISVTIVITFCFAYSALFKEILEICFNSKIKIDEWKNVQAYLIGRIILIFLIFIILKVLRLK
jgi:magnesium-transporting ATPase (P-type)